MPETIRLACELAPLPQGFSGTPQAFAEALVERLRVLFPTGIWTFQIQETEPTSNQGPWIKGTQIWLWNEEEKRYTPLDISPSWQVAIQTTPPADPGVSPIWIKVQNNLVVGFYVYLGGDWVPIIDYRGPTLQRPANPPEYFRYFDTDIGVELYFKTVWRTVTGSPGDIKFVRFATLSEALKFNPGWVEFGTIMGASRGRVFMAAHKDYGTNPAVSFPPLAGITARFATEYFGEETETISVAQLPPHDHPPAADAIGYAAGNGNTGSSGSAFTTISTKPTGKTGDGERHRNMQPSIAFWCLIKQDP